MMKIVLVHHKDHKDINAFSGIPYFMTRAIREEFDEVIDYDAIEPEDLVERLPDCDLQTLLQPLSESLSQFLTSRAADADFVLCQGGNTVAPFYDNAIPLVYWHDSTWHTYLHGHSSESAFESFRTGLQNHFQFDRQALQNASLVIFSSQYIADACIKDYHIDPGKVKVIPFGANLRASPPESFIEQAMACRRSSPRLHLAFIGRDWRRKGLPEAYALTLKLNEMGIDTCLHAIGCDPSLNDHIRSPHVQMHGFIDKSDDTQYQRLSSLLQGTHFLIHPAVSEPYGIVLCEANAHGIPVIGTDVEGLQTIIRQGKNGFLFSPAEFRDRAAELIGKVYTGFNSSYLPLVQTTLEEYRNRLNWRSAVGQLRELLANWQKRSSFSDT